MPIDQTLMHDEAWASGFSKYQKKWICVLWIIDHNSHVAWMDAVLHKETKYQNIIQNVPDIPVRWQDLDLCLVAINPISPELFCKIEDVS